MAKVLGVGGVLFKSPNPQRLNEWYSQWLGMDMRSPPGVTFAPDAMPKAGFTVWSVFAESTDYFAPSEKPFLINLVVDDLDGALKQVRAGGAEVVGGVDEYTYGRFGWFMDPDGNKVELWQPATTGGESRPPAKR